MTTIGGIPAEKWVGRMVRLAHNNDGRRRELGTGAHKIAARLMALHGERAVVHPSGHRGVEVVSIRYVSPWWSKNPDLKALADAGGVTQ